MIETLQYIVEYYGIRRILFMVLQFGKEKHLWFFVGNARFQCISSIYLTEIVSLNWISDCVDERINIKELQNM